MCTPCSTKWMLAFFAAARNWSAWCHSMQLSHWAHCTTSPDSLHRGAAHLLDRSISRMRVKMTSRNRKASAWLNTDGSTPLQTASAFCKIVIVHSCHITADDVTRRKICLTSYLPVNFITNSRLIFRRSLPPEIGSCAEVFHCACMYSTTFHFSNWNK